MGHASNLRIRTTIAAMVVAMLVGSTTCAFAQWRAQRDSGFALSYAYQGGTNGFRLEMSQQETLYNIGWFDASDGDVYCLEVGMNPVGDMGDYGGTPFMVGLGAYRLDSDTPDVDDRTGVNLWAGIGSFDHSSRGLFFQYRYIFGGPLSGNQGILGWAF